ncbi:hypothetical protein F2Q70_00013311 [Brassica cretica]|uniref:Uncharacterized protein n=1 Tax=Brassica cretica TaxID=69181 RepID=A0A8S9LZN7_BRACR|nr:hypothetical protein F2Q70_00013311 [Brassica cretica]
MRRGGWEKTTHAAEKIRSRNLETSWLAPWRCLLPGDLSNYKLPDSVQKKAGKRSQVQVQNKKVNEMLLKVILGGGIENCKGKACVAQFSLRNGCYLIYEAAPKLEQQDGHENREFIILVLDPDVQMLPWENNPVITKQEVYRMPSAGSQYMPSPEIEKLDNPVKPQYKSPVY